MKKLNCTAFVLVMLTAHASLDAATRYVTTTGAGASNCTSWPNACTMAQALSAALDGDQLWVKAGTYPGPLDLPNGVKIIGGFAGTETQASQSNPAINVSIIDAQGSDRAIYSGDDAPSTVLRGFTIKNGNDTSMDGGGGVLVENSSAVFVNCIFESNTASHYGGAAMIKGSGSPTFVNCIFRNNGAGTGDMTKPLGGGGVFLDSGTPTFTNCLFHNNRAGEGGVIMASDGSATLTNCTISVNSAGIADGGAIHDETGRIRLRNTIVWNNTVPSGYSGAQFFNNASLYPASVSHSDVQGGFAGSGNINSDPLFANPIAGDFKLASYSSPCRDAGNNSALPTDVGDLDWDGNTTETISRDLAGQLRKFNGTVDMGCYESSFMPPGGGGGEEY